MSRAVSAGSYRAVLSLPFALRTFAPAIAGRLAYGLFPLATLFTVQQATDSYATAGIASACFGVTTLTLPAKSRLAEHHGQHRVLPLLALVCAVALAGASLVNAPVALIVLIALAGFAAPPLGPAMRANWRRLTAGTGLAPRAYGLDSVVEETLYLVGPLIAGSLIAVWPARWALLLTALLLLSGTAGMVTTPPARHRSPVTRQRRTGRFPGLPGLFAVMFAVGAGSGTAYTCLALAAQDRGRPGLAGVLEASLATGSVIGGLLWARLNHDSQHFRQLRMLVGVLAGGLFVAATAPGLMTLGVVLCLTGTALAPIYVVAYLAVDRLAAEGSAAEASTWINVATNMGGAAGAALAGTIAGSQGPHAGFLAGAALLAVTAGALMRSTRSAPLVPGPRTGTR